MNPYKAILIGLLFAWLYGIHLLTHACIAVSAIYTVVRARTHVGATYPYVVCPYLLWLVTPQIPWHAISLYYRCTGLLGNVNWAKQARSVAKPALPREHYIHECSQQDSIRSYLSFVKHSTAKQEWLPLLRPLQHVQHAFRTPYWRSLQECSS